MPCKLCGKNVYVLGGPEGYVFYESGSLVHKECHEKLLARYGVCVEEEAIV